MDNSVVGSREAGGKANRIPKGMRFFYFMRLTVNGETREGLHATTVAELLEELRIVPGRVAVEVNRNIVRKTEYESFELHEGDAVEVVNFVGGG